MHFITGLPAVGKSLHLKGIEKFNHVSIFYFDKFRQQYFIDQHKINSELSEVFNSELKLQEYATVLRLALQNIDDFLAVKKIIGQHLLPAFLAYSAANNDDSLTLLEVCPFVLRFSNIVDNVHFFFDERNSHISKIMSKYKCNSRHAQYLLEFYEHAWSLVSKYDNTLWRKCLIEHLSLQSITKYDKI